MIIHVYHVLIIGYVFYTLCPLSALLMHQSCIAQAHQMHLVAHTLTFDMFLHSLMLIWSFQTFQHIQHVLVSMSCLGLYHVLSSLACLVYFILCSIVSSRCFILCLSFIFSFILHLPCIICYPCSYLLFFPSLLLIHLSIRDKKGESIPGSIPMCFVISI